MDTAPVPRRNTPWVLGAAMVLGLGLVVAVPRVKAPEAVPAVVAAGAPLRIETEPAGASVWLNDTALGQAPVDAPELPPGRHRVRVAREGYAPAQLSLEIQPGTTPPPLQFVMTPLATLPPATLPPAIQASTPAAPRQAVVAPPAPSRAAAAVNASPGRALPSLLPAWVHDLERDPTITRPRRTAGQDPAYPEAARRLRFGGMVMVEMVVTERGQTTDIRVLHGAGEVLDRAVVEAVRGWRFAPARKDGRPVRVRWRHSQNFDPSA